VTVWHACTSIPACLHSGHHIIEILRKGDDNLTDEDLGHMAKVVSVMWEYGGVPSMTGLDIYAPSAVSG
jgi:hypothetical protein